MVPTFLEWKIFLIFLYFSSIMFLIFQYFFSVLFNEFNKYKNLFNKYISNKNSETK